MSGRRLVPQPDGRVTRGYRKTMRINRPRTDEKPTLRATFQLPAVLSMVRPGLHLGGAVTVGGMANVSAVCTTWNRNDLFKLVARFVQEVSIASMPPWSVSLVYESSSEPGWRDTKWRLLYLDGHVVVHRSMVDPLVVTR